MNRKSIRIVNLPRDLDRKLKRALQVLGAGSRSQWLYVQVLRAIRDAEQQHELPISEILTDEERFIGELIFEGCYEIQDLITESHMTVDNVRRILQQMVTAELVEVRKQGGKTDQARGASKSLYVLTRQGLLLLRLQEK
jgi:predicted transcriptional regulator